MNLTPAVGNSLRGKPCNVFGSDMKVGITKKRGFAYPDLTIACGERKFYDEVRDVLMNPVALFEVLSDSTREFDATEKFREYKRLDSLRHYVMVEPAKKVVIHYERLDDGRWVYEEFSNDTDLLDLRAVGIAIPLLEIYDGIDL
jgi:Uma2 family endonuclease